MGARDRSPLSRAEKDLLHDLRQVRNPLVHNTEVHVAKNFARTALQRLHQIAIRLDMGRLTAAAVMTRDVLSVPPDKPLSEVQAMLWMIQMCRRWRFSTMAACKAS